MASFIRISVSLQMISRERIGEEVSGMFKGASSPAPTSLVYLPHLQPTFLLCSHPLWQASLPSTRAVYGQKFSVASNSWAATSLRIGNRVPSAFSVHSPSIAETAL